MAYKIDGCRECVKFKGDCGCHPVDMFEHICYNVASDAYKDACGNCKNFVERYETIYKCPYRSSKTDPWIVNECAHFSELRDIHNIYTYGLEPSNYLRQICSLGRQICCIQIDKVVNPDLDKLIKRYETGEDPYVKEDEKNDILAALRKYKEEHNERRIQQLH